MNCSLYSFVRADGLTNKLFVFVYVFVYSYLSNLKKQLHVREEVRISVHYNYHMVNQTLAFHHSYLTFVPRCWRVEHVGCFRQRRGICHFNVNMRKPPVIMKQLKGDYRCVYETSNGAQSRCRR